MAHIMGEHARISESLYDARGNQLAVSNDDKRVIGEVEVLCHSKSGDKPLFTRSIHHNDLLVTGATFMQEKINGFRSRFITDPIDVKLGIHTAADLDVSSETIPGEIIYGLMVGNGGTGDTYNTVTKVNRSARNVPGIVPFRVVPLTADLSPTERARYILRKVQGDQAYYYGKRFDSDPVITVAYEDGTVVPVNAADLPAVSKFVKVYTTYRVTIGAKDIREYFKLTQGSTVRSLVNSCGLVTGYVGNSEDGYPELFNCRGLTTMNMENQELKDTESTITFIYRFFIQ